MYSYSVHWLSLWQGLLSPCLWVQAPSDRPYRSTIFISFRLEFLFVLHSDFSLLHLRFWTRNFAVTIINPWLRCTLTHRCVMWSSTFIFFDLHACTHWCTRKPMHSRVHVLLMAAIWRSLFFVVSCWFESMVETNKLIQSSRVVSTKRPGNRATTGGWRPRSFKLWSIISQVSYVCRTLNHCLTLSKNWETIKFVEVGTESRSGATGQLSTGLKAILLLLPGV